MACTTSTRLSTVRNALSAFPPPIILYNKSHSGSRLVAHALRSQGVFLGSDRNVSEDALPILRIVESVVTRYYPDYRSLWHGDPADTARLAHTVADAFQRHLTGYDPQRHQAWGWKLCETMYAMPLFDFLFPQAQVVHLLRDGRDVAWTDHVAPELPFWRKVYFGTTEIKRWRGLEMTDRAYRRRPQVYNALHWTSSVQLGRAYGSMLGDRYFEVRYEDVCRDFMGTMQALLGDLGLAEDTAALTRLNADVHRDSLQKFRTRPGRLRRQVMHIIEPTLRSLGYPVEPTTGLRALLDRWRAAWR